MLKRMVPKAGLEPARLAPLPPQDSVSTNSTTSAQRSKTSGQSISILSSMEQRAYYPDLFSSVQCFLSPQY
jgi:hypothetical protein